MHLNTTQTYEIEQALFKAKKIEAIKLYREATGDSLSDAKTAVEKILVQLMRDKPWMFDEKSKEALSSTSKSIPKSALIVFLIVDAIIFGAAIFWFFFYQTNEKNAEEQQDRVSVEEHRKISKESTPTIEAPIAKVIAKPVIKPKKEALPKIKTKQSVIKINQNNPMLSPLPLEIDKNDYIAEIKPGDTFVSLYNEKLNDHNYQQRKSNVSSSRSFDNSLLERKIKTIRSQLAASRSLPKQHKLFAIPRTVSKTLIDGKIEQSEWSESLALEIGGKKDTTVYLQSDGKWLFISCDARDELSHKGYDQFRVYLHAGLIDKMPNERIHLGRSKRITSIRQTKIYWPGDKPDTKAERWKKYAISDWGIYKYAIGSSDIHGNRHYEVAIHLEEAGIPLNHPFTLSAEVETDPLKDSNGKFKKRQYLGYLGSQQQPFWFYLLPE
ncbi:MAG: hypothetical protein HQL46_08175 [Gammaproteobacteria bacterium]|nr:hypothetical protein [Gammaproteobacteria bacterium]